MGVVFCFVWLVCVCVWGGGGGYAKSPAWNPLEARTSLGTAVEPTAQGAEHRGCMERDQYLSIRRSSAKH